MKKKKSHLRQSKTDNFLEKIREDNTMIDYITSLRVMNPAATLRRDLNEPRREGSFVRLAHAREEFTAPILTKGKSVIAAQKESATKKKKSAKKKTAKKTAKKRR